MKGQNHSRLLKMSLPRKIPDGEGTNMVCSHRREEIDFYERKRVEKKAWMKVFIKIAKNMTRFCQYADLL